MNFVRARERMVEEQLVNRGISDLGVLAAVSRIERHRFVDEALQVRAYDDHPLPIGERQTISQPYMVGLMTQALELRGHERVLEIGTGCGYQTAVLAELVATVYTVARLAVLAAAARATLETHFAALEVGVRATQKLTASIDAELVRAADATDDADRAGGRKRNKASHRIAGRATEARRASS